MHCRVRAPERICKRCRDINQDCNEYCRYATIYNEDIPVNDRVIQYKRWIANGEIPLKLPPEMKDLI